MASGTCTVHVYDEGRSSSKDFSCKTDTLLSSMKYFKSYLKDVQPQQNVMISVHCDVQVFEWLLQFAQSSKGGNVPHGHQPISVSSVMPILISSNFLGMDDLVNLCLRFVAQNLTCVASASADLAALPTDLLLRLAKVVGEEQLESLHSHCSRNPLCSSNGSSPTSSEDSNEAAEGGAAAAKKRQTLEQLSGRLYKHKIELLLRDLRTTVARCSHCGAMFSLAEKGKLNCPVKDGEHQWGAQGDNRQRMQGHEPDPSWRLQDHLAALRAGASVAKLGDGDVARADNTQLQHPQASWRDIYWDVWSVVTVLYCSHCLRFFPAQELATCCYHPEPAIFLASKSVGRYPCCGGHAQRSGMVQLFRGGCCARDHQVVAPTGGAGAVSGDAGALQRVLQMLETFRHLVVPETSSELNVVEWGGDGGEDEDEDVGVDEDGTAEDGKGRLTQTRAGFSGVPGPGPSSLALARAVYSGGGAGMGRQVGRGQVNGRVACRGSTGFSRPQTAVALSRIGGSQGVSPSMSMPRAMSASVNYNRSNARTLSDHPASAFPSTARTSGTSPLRANTPGASDDGRGALLARSMSARPVSAVPPVSAIARSMGPGQVFGGTSYRDDDGGGGMCSPRPAEMLDVLKLAAAARNEAAAAAAAQQKVAPVNVGPQLSRPMSAGPSTSNAGALAQSSFSATAYMAGSGVAAAAAAAATAPVKVVPLSSLQGSGSVGRSPGGAMANGTMARKLRLELLHEDDVARMDALISHLTACRPQQARSRQVVLHQAPSKTSGRPSSSHSLRSNAGGGGTGSPGTNSPTSAGAHNPARSSSASRMARDIAGARAAGASVAVSMAGALGMTGGRPTSAPRMRPPLVPLGHGLAMAAASAQRTILAQR